MLKVPQLDEVTYDQIIQKAISRIPARTEAVSYTHLDVYKRQDCISGLRSCLTA